MREALASQPNSPRVHKDGITDTDSVVEIEGKLTLQQAFIQLRAEGLSYARIAKRLKVAKGTLANWQRELEGEIAQARAIELEALQESFFLLKEGRIRLLGEQLKAVQEELKGRSLSDVSTEKLVDILLKLHAELKTEFTETQALTQKEIHLMRDGSGTEVNADTITLDITKTLLRLRAGLISNQQAKDEVSILQGLLKAKELVDIQRQLDEIQAALSIQEGGGQWQ
jgi:transcriptional regulator with XRE-family HTH domain